jgi:hypothetical protein
MPQEYEQKVEESREVLENIPKDKLTDGQHVALAIHRLGDLFEEYLETLLEYNDDDDPEE